MPWGPSGDAPVIEYNIRMFPVNRLFNPAIRENPVITFFGARGTGKTTVADVILYLAKLNGNKRNALLMTGTPDSQLTKRFPSTYVHEGFQDGILGELIHEQQDQSKRHKLAPHLYKRPQSWGVVLEDLMNYNEEINRSHNVKTVTCNGRWNNVWMMIMIQYYTQLTKPMRNMSDFVFVFAEADRDVRHQLWKSFFTALQEWEFEEFMRRFTQDHGCLVVDLTSRNRPVEECIFWFRVRPLPKDYYKFGGRSYWQFHFENRKSKEEKLRELNDEKERRQREWQLHQLEAQHKQKLRIRRISS